MSTSTGYQSSLSSSRLSSYTPRQYLGSTYSSTSSYYKPPLPTYRSTLPRSYLASSYYPSTSSTTRRLSNSYYTSPLTSNLSNSFLAKSTSHISTLGSSYRSSTGNINSTLSSTYYPSSTYESLSRRNSSFDSISAKSTNYKNCDIISYKKLDNDIKEVGLRNLGNTCFMNAAFQCLLHTKPLVDVCRAEGHQNGELIKEFVNLIKTMEHATTAYSPKELKTAIQKYAPHFAENSQQDAQELLNYLMQGLHDDLKKPKFLSSSSIKELNDFKKYQVADHSLIVDLFGGELKSTLQCSICKNESTTYDPFWDLSLPIPEKTDETTLHMCFDVFSRPETLDEQNKAYCSLCKKKNCFTKRMQINKFPKVLIIHLKRMALRRTRRMSVLVDCPINLIGLSKFTPHNGYTRNDSYQLYSVIDYIGVGSSGHFVAKCKADHVWYEFNDDKVRETDDIITRYTYILFYVKK